jgi:hypothetical protein
VFHDAPFASGLVGLAEAVATEMLDEAGYVESGRE